MGRLRLYAELTRLHRPIGILLLLWPTWWALWLASGGLPDWRLLAVFTAGVVSMRSAGCAINDYLDRDFDRHVARTRQRPLARGALRPVEALGVCVALLVVSLALVLTLNRRTQELAVIGALLALTYPLGKRLTHLPQVYLGLAFGWGIPMAFAAVQDKVPPIAWLLLIANVFWTVAYDTFYAMADRADDVRIGVKSTAILFGDDDRLIIGVLQASALATLALVGWQARLGVWFFAGLGLAALTAAHHQYLARHREPAACFRAFLANNWFGAAVFAGIAVHYGVSM
ncbi:MAG TPA: 4-hydroxybenzoate octaprenyltransferase [Gammaproteobacteria bacterium]|nr:4-hydroxybenzoate octaprenyltransferase [Gammaproteobacteria bacterium]MCH78773.1 4-hydroxybenzoate octaprenyltransferase [Gammaproteobacteria bacterium]